MTEFFYKGGPLMYPLLLGSVLTAAVTLERLYHYLRAAPGGDLASRVAALLRAGDADGALAAARGAPGPLAAVLAEALSLRGADKTQLEEAVSLRGSRELARLSARLHVLELTGRMAPLVGLLGTVLGMLEAFQTVSALKGAVDPSLLAGGIWAALITTVAGLCVAIPALVAHHLFSDKVRSCAFEMKHGASEIVALLEPRR